MDLPKAAIETIYILMHSRDLVDHMCTYRQVPPNARHNGLRTSQIFRSLDEPFVCPLDLSSMPTVAKSGRVVLVGTGVRRLAADTAEDANEPLLTCERYTFSMARPMLDSQLPLFRSDIWR